MGQGKERSTGRRKEARKGKNLKSTKRAIANRAGFEQIQNECSRRFPSKESEETYAALNMVKQPRGRRGGKGQKKPEFFFPLLESLPTDQIRKVLLCSSLELKAVKRYPGWILSRTYNLKNRVLSFG